MPVNRDEIRLAYLYILGREPKSDRVYDLFADQPNVRSLRKLLLRSKEGQQVIRSNLPQFTQHPYFDFCQVAICFIHLEKTGGTSIYKMIEKHFEPDRLSPSHLSISLYLKLPFANKQIRSACRPL